MIRKIAWETFKNTGNINSFMELKQIENIEKQIYNMSSELNKDTLEDSKSNTSKRGN